MATVQLCTGYIARTALYWVPRRNNFVTVLGYPGKSPSAAEVHPWLDSEKFPRLLPANFMTQVCIGRDFR